MHIIVASHNLFRRELSSFILSEAGYTVHEATDSTSLCDYLHGMNPDLVLLDSHLLDKESQYLVQHLHQLATVPVMFLTSSHGIAESATSWHTHATSYLTWPYEAQDLLAHVQALIGDQTMCAASMADIVQTESV
ncbi:MAG: response regulator transcription factor [Chloroflexaceae bacterium]|nr:response regulator transcription factor [Chloroflexaceae bacterium]